ncbi:hypothetical protein K5I04_04300 [Murdochiella sp. Marseille-P8839]|nr:hypothetical protein [Murdochiella sp. Marseille-P8839]
MSRFWSLVKINVILSLNRSGQTLNRSKKAKSKSLLGTIALFLFAGGMFFLSGLTMATEFADQGLMKPYFAYGCMMGLAMTTTVVFSFAAATLFYSSDAQVYLAMPLSPREILGAKLVSLLLQSYLMQLLIFLPTALAGVVVAFSLQSLLAWIVLFFLLPIVPVCLVTVVMLLLLQVAPALRNERRLTFFTGIITLAGAIAVSLSMQFSSRIAYAQDISMSVPKWLGMLFPVFRYGQDMAFGASGAMAGAYGLILLTSILWMAVTFLLASKLYFPILLSLGSGEHGKALTSDALRTSTGKERGVLLSLASREAKSILRVPAFVLNAVMMPYVMIAVSAGGAVVALVRSGEAAGLDTLRELFLTIADTPSSAFHVGVLAGLAIALIGAMGSLTSTTISRDARHLDFLKSVPVPAFTIFMGKFLGSAIFGLVPMILLWIVCFALFPFIPLVHLTLVVVSLFTCYGMLMWDLYIDIYSPKLDWMDELGVIKQNKNVFISQMKTFAMMMLAIPLIVSGHLRAAGTLFAGLYALSGFVLTALLKNNADKRLMRIGEGK